MMRKQDSSPVLKVLSLGSACCAGGMLILLMAVGCQPTQAQNGSSTSYNDVKAVPLMSGGVAYTTQVEGGHPVAEPIVAPVVLVPLGERWLVESRGDFEGDIETRDNGNLGATVQKEVDYLQLDYIANKYVTVTVGRFLTPFGIFNERLYPIWIRTFSSEPLIFPLGTGSGNGAMLRGGFQVSPAVEMNYAVYFSALANVSALDSERTAGARIGFFFPKQRFEIGASGQHLLQEGRTNTYGLHMEWQPLSHPLTLRSEYAYDAKGKGYWAEATYRLTELPFAQRLARHTDLDVRGQQFFLGKASGGNDALQLPTAQTNQIDLGINYYFRDDIRIQASYGRSLSTAGNQNLWSIGVTYRFAFPLLPGGKQ